MYLKDINKGAFPILVEYLDTGEEVVCLAPTDIETGRAFKVLKISGIQWGDEWIFSDGED